MLRSWLRKWLGVEAVSEQAAWAEFGSSPSSRKPLKKIPNRLKRRLVMLPDRFNPRLALRWAVRWLSRWINGLSNAERAEMAQQLAEVKAWSARWDEEQAAAHASTCASRVVPAPLCGCREAKTAIESSTVSTDLQSQQ